MTGEPALLFDPDLENALAQVEEHASSEWMNECRNVIRRLAAIGARFTSDDVWASMDVFAERRGIVQEPRALGVVMREAARDGVIVALDEHVKSRRSVCHGRLVRCWVGKSDPCIPTRTV